MKFAHRIAHLIFPRESNNQKAKLLHSSSLSLLTLFLVIFQLALNILPKIYPRILGFAANISPTEVIRLTNEKRAQSGLPALTENGTLSQAALAKGTDMINRDYWSHVSPDGTQPWVFITNAGYKYRYAGENLARDFSNPSSAVDAWMASSSHKENILSPKYKEVGIAVVEGDLAGVDTTIIVQFFGTKYVDSLPVVPVAQAKPNTEATPTPKPIALTTSEPKPTTTPLVVSNTQEATKLTEPIQGKSKFTFSPFYSTRNISLIVVGVLLTVLIADWIVANKRKIARIGGRSFAHISFLAMVLIIVLILKVGQII